MKEWHGRIRECACAVATKRARAEKSSECVAARACSRIKKPEEKPDVAHSAGQLEVIFETAKRVLAAIFALQPRHGAAHNSNAPTRHNRTSNKHRMTKLPTRRARRASRAAAGARRSRHVTVVFAFARRLSFRGCPVI